MLGRTVSFQRPLKIPRKNEKLTVAQGKGVTFGDLQERNRSRSPTINDNVSQDLPDNVDMDVPTSSNSKAGETEQPISEATKQDFGEQFCIGKSSISRKEIF